MSKKPKSRSGASPSDNITKSIISKAEQTTGIPTSSITPGATTFEKVDKKKPSKKSKSTDNALDKSKSKKSKKNSSRKSDSKKSTKSKKRESKKSKPEAIKCKPKSSEQHRKKSERKKESKEKKEKQKSKDNVKSHGKSESTKMRKASSSEDGYKLKNKPKSAEKSWKMSSSTSKGHPKVATTVADTFTSAEKKEMGIKVRKVEVTQGAIAVTNESAITSSGYVVEGPKLFQSDYSMVLRARKGTNKSRIVVKVVNLAETSPRSRANLLINSVRIMRFISSAADKNKGPLSPLFIVVHDIFLVCGVKLFIFMNECDSNRSLYDMVKSKQTLTPSDIRKWFRDMVAGVDALQQMGCAHRSIKLQHLLFDFNAKNVKLCGWSKCVFFYDPHKKRIQLQRKERRVRRNYHLPPESFLASYEPSKADIWSLGVALVAMSTKRYPFNVRDKKTKFSSQWRQFVKNHELNTYVRNFCHKTFVIDPKIRISTDNLLTDKYFSVPADKLTLLSCKADLTEVREDSRVGGVSTIELDVPTGRSTKSKGKDAEPKSNRKAAEELAAEDDPVDWVAFQKADKSGVDENATGFEGGNVGEEEHLPANELEMESQGAENAAPEEGEAEAQPEDGEMLEPEDAALADGPL